MEMLTGRVLSYVCILFWLSFRQDAGQDDVVSFSVLLHRFGNVLPYGADVLLRVFLRRDMEVADDVEADLSRRDAEVVRMVLGVFLLDERIQQAARLRDDLLVRTQGVHVDAELDLEFFLDFVFQYV